MVIPGYQVINYIKRGKEEYIGGSLALYIIENKVSNKLEYLGQPDSSTESL